jgi:chaperonin GroEL
MNPNKNERDFIDQRISLLMGKVGVIYVGANSDIEQKEKYDRVEDAVCALKSAMEEGILPGGGIALLGYADKMYGKMSEVLRQSLLTPFEQILVNAGKDPITVIGNISDYVNKGYDVKNDKYGDMYKMGIIDPAKVTKNALRNAVSVATTILSTNAIMTMKRK